MAQPKKDTGRQIYPPTVTESLMQRIRTLTKPGKAGDTDGPAAPEAEPAAPKAPKEPADWKAAVGYGPLVLRVGKTDGKAELPRIGTLKKAVQSALKASENKDRRGKPAPAGEIGSFDSGYAADGAVCQYSLRRVGQRAEGHARRTASDGPSYDKPFTADAAALDGLQRLVAELDMKRLADEPPAEESVPSAGESTVPAGEDALHAHEGTHLAIWYMSGESVRCHDSRKNRLTRLQAAAIRSWFEAVAGV